LSSSACGRRQSRLPQVRRNEGLTRTLGVDCLDEPGLPGQCQKCSAALKSDGSMGKRGEPRTAPQVNAAKMVAPPEQASEANGHQAACAVWYEENYCFDARCTSKQDRKEGSAV